MPAIIARGASDSRRVASDGTMRNQIDWTGKQHGYAY
jgi:hypothetical protein